MLNMDNSEARNDLDELHLKLEKTKDIIYSKLDISWDYCIFQFFPWIIEHWKKNIISYHQNKKNLDDLNKIFYFTELISHPDFTRAHAQKVVNFIRKEVPCQSSCVYFDNYSYFDKVLKYTESISKKQFTPPITFDIKKIVSRLTIF